MKCADCDKEMLEAKSCTLNGLRIETGETYLCASKESLFALYLTSFAVWTFTTPTRIYP